MEQHEYIGVENQVIDFLRGFEVVQITSEAEQVVALHVFNKLRSTARLPEVPVSFDSEGTMSIDMSSDDVARYKSTFDERFEPHIERALEARDRKNRLLPRPSEPEFLNDPEKASVRLEKGDAGLLELLGDDEQREFEGYLRLHAAWFRVVEDNSLVPKAVWQGWDEENLDIHYLSLKGEYRDVYDQTREMQLMDVLPAV